jgi:hypothetical protein
MWNYMHCASFHYTPRNKVGGYTVFSMSVCLYIRPLSMFCFPDIFRINFADNEMKLCMIVYNNELQIKFEFRRYWFKKNIRLSYGP